MPIDINAYLQAQQRIQAPSGAATSTPTNSPATNPPPAARKNRIDPQSLLNFALTGKSAFNAITKLPGLNRLGTYQEAPKWGQFLADTFLSPVGLAATALAPVTAGSSLGLEGALGTAARVGTRLGAEAAVNAVAGQGAELASKVLPETTPTPLKVAAMALGGLAAGGAAATGITRALGVDATKAAARAEIEANAHAHGFDVLMQPEAFDKTVANVATLPQNLPGKIAREANSTFGVNPSANAVGPTGIAKAALDRRQAANTGLVTASVASAFPSGFSAFKRGANDVVEGLNVPLGDILSTPDAPAKFALTPAQTSQWQTARKFVDEANKMYESRGLKVPEIPLPKDQVYWPHMTTASAEGDFLRAADRARPRDYNTMAEGVANGAQYMKAEDTLRGFLGGVYEDVAQADFEDAMTKIGVPIDKAVAATPEGRIAQLKMSKADRQVNALRKAIDNVQASGGDTKSLVDRLTTVRDRQSAARDEWTNIRNRNYDRLPGAIFGKGQDSIPVAQWKQQYYIPADADYRKLVNFFNPLTAAEETPAIPSKVRLAEQAGNLARFTAATADFAMPFTQGLPLLALDPVAWGKMAFHHYAAFVDPSIQGNYIAKNWGSIQDMIANGGVSPAEVEIFKAIEKDGLARWIKSVPGVGGTVKRFQASYDSGLTVARHELWSALKPVWTGEDAQLGKFVRNATGGLESKSLGVGPTQRAVESMLFFAPRMLRSTLALTADAMRPWTPQGGIAAHTLARLTAAMAGVMMLGNIAAAGSNNWTDSQLEQALLDTLNPLGGRKFLSIPFNKHYYGVGGQARGITQLLTAAIANPGSLAQADALKNPLIRFAEGKVSPFADAALGAAELVTHEDHNILPFNQIDNMPDLLGMMGSSAMPFALQAAQAEGWDLTNPLVTAETFIQAPSAETLGARTSRFTPTDLLNSTAQERYGMDYRDLTGDEQKVVRDLNPEAAKGVTEFNSKAQKVLNTRLADNATEASTSVQTLNQQLSKGAITPKQYKDMYHTALQRRFDRDLQARVDLGGDFGPADSDKAKVLDAYYNTFTKAEIVPGQVDWNVWDELQGQLTTDIKNGVYGAPTRAQQYIDERSGTKLQGDWFATNQKYLRDSGYWSVTDTAFARVAPIVHNVDPNINNSGALAAAIDLATAQGDTATVARLAVAQRMLDRFTGPLREQMRRRDPQLDASLFMNGYVTKLVNPQAKKIVQATPLTSQ